MDHPPTHILGDLTRLQTGTPQPPQDTILTSTISSCSGGFLTRSKAKRTAGFLDMALVNGGGVLVPHSLFELHNVRAFVTLHCMPMHSIALHYSTCHCITCHYLVLTLCGITLTLPLHYMCLVCLLHCFSSFTLYLCHINLHVCYMYVTFTLNGVPFQDATTYMPCRIVPLPNHAEINTLQARDQAQ